LLRHSSIPRQRFSAKTGTLTLAAIRVSPEDPTIDVTPELETTDSFAEEDFPSGL
jgi:hypothetical protein